MARGLEPIADADVEDYRWMFETNVLGTLRMTKSLLPALVASGGGRIVNISSGTTVIAPRQGWVPTRRPSRR